GSYREWYKVFADAIEPSFRTTFTQYQVAWAVTHYTFNSRSSLRPRADWSSLLPPSDEMPDSRHRRLLAVLSTKADDLYARMLGDFHSACAEFGLPAWDFQSEDEWHNNTVRHDLSSLGMDSRLTQVVSLWLREKSGVPVIDFDSQTELGQTKTLLEELNRQAG